MPLTSVLGGQGHCKLRHSIDRIRVPVVCGHILYAYCFPGKAIVENRDFSYPLLLQQPRGKKTVANIFTPCFTTERQIPVLSGGLNRFCTSPLALIAQAR